MQGKMCLVTGASGGIGLATAKALADRGASVVIHARNDQKGKAAVAKVIQASGNTDVRFVAADLSSLEEVRALAEAFIWETPKLDVLVHNAAVMTSRRKTTPDGYEEMFAVNYLAPFLLTHLLLDKLRASAPARIVMVSSGGYRMGRLDFDDLMSERRFSTIRAYGGSKLALMLFTRALAARLEGTGVSVNSLHPGGVLTEGMIDGPGGKLISVLLKPILLTPEQGARTSVHLASSPEVEGRSGGYYVKGKAIKTTPAARDDAAAERLWRESVRLTGLAG